MKAVVRFFIMATAGITAFAGTVSALDHELSGHARTRFEWVKNPGAVDSTDAEGFFQRVKLNIDVMPAKSLKVRLTPQVNYVWGTSAAPGTATLNAQEAWMMWQMNDAWSLTAGRMEVVYGNELIFGDRDWTNAGIAHDAAKLSFASSMGTHDFLWVRVAENGATAAAGTSGDNYAGTGNTDGDHDIMGLYNQFEISNEAIDDLHFYLLWRNNRTAAANNRAVYFGGLVGGSMGTIDYGLELAGVMGYAAGSSDMYKGLMADANIGASLQDRHYVNLNIAYGNTEWVDVSPDIHRHLGDADVVGRNNVFSFGLQTKWGLSDVFAAHIDGYYFMRLKDSGAGGVFAAAGGAGTDKPLGFEGDLVLAYMPMDNMNVDLGYAFFKPLGERDTAAAGVIHDLYVQGTLSF